MPLKNNEIGKRDPGTCNEPCPIERGMRLIGGKWKGSILWHLKDEPQRFNELSRLLRGASRKVLTQRLTEMEEMKLLKREVISSRPIAVQYSITKFGKSTLKILEELKDWTEKHGV